jgi:hypothetical protein
MATAKTPALHLALTKNNTLSQQSSFDAFDLDGPDIDSSDVMVIH